MSDELTDTIILKRNVTEAATQIEIIKENMPLLFSYKQKEDRQIMT